ncbi:type II toxin-antitoxin system VapC family toxin (plasmid) [Skermanella mucosa]|uniref:type II toxin-antitoxin system VapC family toxin n=1 Tax=Skermanella mucosa TaxID=1789672 RepID=UPI00192C5E58|nr:type II toxin-antitoxin system VapC family toxin [Skermanella mucosa]UEM25152.1 type II toxin-antitoxin system VapC family toxin [Skermanella mucosa]
MTLIDTNVLLDIVTDDPAWADWSILQLDAASFRGPLAINGVIYAELSVRFERIEDLDAVLDESGILLTEIPRDALFLAGKAFKRYRSAGGTRTGVLPDFFIGAHAAVSGMALLPRDLQRYQSYFPGLTLIAPRT